MNHKATATATSDEPVTGSSLSVLSAQGIEKSFRQGMWPVSHRQSVLRGVDLTLSPGEVVVLVGENGSGKSTMMKILVGELAPDAGTVTRSGILGYCPQQPVVYDRLTCDEHIELFARAYRMTHEAERRARRDLYEALGFERYAGTRADRLSGGTLAKLNLTLAMLPDPQVLLLDEPYAGLDWDTYLKFWELMSHRREAGRSVLIISHFVADEHRFDRILQLCNGQVCTGQAVPR
ncbi:ABC-type multidrug transport system, ATPase component [Mycolicibacterium rhodesiae NBB3]|uniref:ABC-type multidrug transport system, ATPase component n=1 Tax=Mycolicibacterium rhodesiae (strain NBB3) TaxID=710685 RepID=G8RI72_MYCRN|nr:ABC transporter ATP-binding protein [Mycolicibacterium rhodesiae]AEV73409.1 ABC-type multidrug transport system, ATPase component [Mycolicibacterium rhodesiae NBB3]